LKRRLRNHLFDAVIPESLPRIYNAYDLIGDIAVVRDGGLTGTETGIVAGTIMDTHRNVKTVLAQTGAIEGSLRLRRLEYVAGRNKTETEHRESGCLFRVDVEKCYFSPRLLHERMRIASLVHENEVVFNMFAGVGCFSIIIAKHSRAKKVYSVDINPDAVKYMQENIRINGTFGKIIPILGDSKDIAKNSLRHSVNRVLMPLPELALEYLPYALMALTENGGWMHFYGFEHVYKNENPLEKAQLNVASRLSTLGTDFRINNARVVRTTGPNWHQVVLDILIG
jgi:tRNA (guanine37-N1)-methyltransferase